MTDFLWTKIPLFWKHFGEMCFYCYQEIYEHCTQRLPFPRLTQLFSSFHSQWPTNYLPYLWEASSLVNTKSRWRKCAINFQLNCCYFGLFTANGAKLSDFRSIECLRQKKSNLCGIGISFHFIYLAMNSPWRTAQTNGMWIFECKSRHYTKGTVNT